MGNKTLKANVEENTPDEIKAINAYLEGLEVQLMVAAGMSLLRVEFVYRNVADPNDKIQAYHCPHCGKIMYPAGPGGNIPKIRAMMRFGYHLTTCPRRPDHTYYMDVFYAIKEQVLGHGVPGVHKVFEKYSPFGNKYTAQYNEIPDITFELAQTQMKRYVYATLVMPKMILQNNTHCYNDPRLGRIITEFLIGPLS